MRIRRLGDTELTIVDFPVWIGVFTLTVGGVSVYRLALAVGGRSGRDEWIGGGIGLLLSAVAAWLMFRRSVFVFDRVRRQLTWSRWGLFGTNRGVVPFDDIEGVTAQSLRAGRRPSYRVAMLLRGQAALPITLSYGLGEEKQCESIRDAIEDFVLSSR